MPRIATIERRAPRVAGGVPTRSPRVCSPACPAHEHARTCVDGTLILTLGRERALPRQGPISRQRRLHRSRGDSSVFDERASVGSGPRAWTRADGPRPRTQPRTVAVAVAVAVATSAVCHRRFEATTRSRIAAMRSPERLGHASAVAARPSPRLWRVPGRLGSLPARLWRVPGRLGATAAVPLKGTRTRPDDRRRAFGGCPDASRRPPPHLWRVPGRLGRRAVAHLDSTGTPREARRGAFGQYRDASGPPPTALGGPRESFGASFPAQPAPPLGFAGGVAATRSGTAAAAGAATSAPSSGATSPGVPLAGATKAA